MARNSWQDKQQPKEAYELSVQWNKKDESRHIAHVTVPYDRSGNKKLYVKVALTATWMRRVFADRAFSVRRARDVANATEIMADMKTVTAAISMIEELCRFHAHDSTSRRRFPSPCVVEAQTPPTGFNFLEADADGTLFAVSIGRVSGTKVHVYTGEGDGKHLVVVLGAESDVATVVETFRLMLGKVADGLAHDEARAWAIGTLTEVCAPEPDKVGDGSSCLDDTELPPEELEAEVEASPAPIITAPVTVLRRRADEVDSWTEEKKRVAEAAATYAAAASAPPAKRELQPLPPANGTVTPPLTKGVVNAPAFVPAHMIPPTAFLAPMYTCRGCGLYPRRVAFLPCAHLALCSACSDVHVKARAPCLMCGQQVMQRQTFYLE